MIQLETKRLILRPFSLDDVEEFAPICADPDVMKYIGQGQTQTKEQVEKTVKQWLSGDASKGYCMFALIEKSSNNLLGFCGLYPQFVDGELLIELGYRLAKSHWGQGIAYEAACAVRDHAFDTVGFEQLIAIIQKENQRSIDLAKRVGMVQLTETFFEEIPVYIYTIKK